MKDNFIENEIEILKNKFWNILYMILVYVKTIFKYLSYNYMFHSRILYSVKGRDDM